MIRLVRTTILGGIVFLFPIVVFLAVIQEGLQLTDDLAKPLADALTVETIGGLAIIKLLAIFILIVLCFAAGLLAKTRLANRFVRWLEDRILGRFPAYALIKTKTHSTLTPDDVHAFRPTLLKTGEIWKLAYVTQQLSDTQCMVFVPSAPNAWAGSLSVVPVSHTAPLDMSVKAMADVIRALGHQVPEALKESLERVEHTH